MIIPYNITACYYKHLIVESKAIQINPNHLSRKRKSPSRNDDMQYIYCRLRLSSNKVLSGVGKSITAARNTQRTQLQKCQRPKGIISVVLLLSFYTPTKLCDNQRIDELCVFNLCTVLHSFNLL